MIQHIFTRYRVIDKIDLKENAVKMMGPYDLAEPLSRLIKLLVKGIEFPCSGGQTISDVMMMSKGNPLLAQTAMFNDYIRYWILQTTDFKTRGNYKTFFRRAHYNNRRVVSTTGKGGYTAAI